MLAEETARGTQRMIYVAPVRLAIAPSHTHLFAIGDHSLRGSDGIEGWCGGDTLSTGYGALQHERVEIGSSCQQDGGEARRARTKDTHRAMVGLRVIALLTESTM